MKPTSQISPSQLITTIPAAPRVVVFAHSLALFVLLAGLTSAATGLGTTGTSANPAAGNSVTVNSTTTETVNTATGNSYVSISDLVVPGRGLRFHFVRSYNSLDPYSGPLGVGWTHSYNIVLSVDNSGAVTVKEADGQEHVFQPGTTAGTYIAPSGVYDVLANTGTNTYRLTRPDQTVLSFGPIALNSTIVRLLSITDKNDNTQTLAYDATGNLITFTDVGGGTFTFAYDSLNHITSLHDGALNRTLSYAYDAGNVNLTSFTNPTGSVSHYTYNSSNQLSVAIDPRTNVAIDQTFDSQGRVVSTRRGSSCPSTYSYDDVNHITTFTDALGHVTRFYYDSSSRLTKTVNAIGAQTTFAYDGNNNITSVTNPLGKTTSLTYDSHGNRTSITDPLTHLTTFSFDSNNNLLSLTDANGNATHYVYDMHGNLTTVLDAAGGTTHFTYDSRGNKLTFTNANGKTTSYTYNSGNRLVSATDPLSKTEAWTYDAGGRMLTQTEAAGNVKSLTYDSLSRVTAVSYVQGAMAQQASSVTYAYDANGNRTSMTDSNGATNYTYDALNRPTAISFPTASFPSTGATVSYSYDCNDNRTAITYGGKTISYTYDANNRMSAVSDGTRTTSYSYDLADNLLSISYPNDGSVGYSYDDASRIRQVTNLFAGSSTATSTPISSFTYVLDNVGNRTQITDGNGKVTALSYDPVYRVTRTTVASKATSYTYDAVGNRLTMKAPSISVTYTYDAGDRLLSAGTMTFTYDDNGNLLSSSSGAGPVTYSYDSANRLVGVTGGLVANSFSYDGDGHRISQQVGTGTYFYLNDITTGLPTVLQEQGPDGSIFYTRGRGLISATAPNFTFYYHYDAQSTIAGLTDSTGHLAQRYLYDIWGQRNMSVPGPQVGTQNKFGYTGEALDPGTSLYYLGARYYNPVLGRFISKDPFEGFAQVPSTLNRFVYALDNPASQVERNGLYSSDERNATDKENACEKP
jgi:RHS repeat-associated protein